MTVWQVAELSEKAQGHFRAMRLFPARAHRTMNNGPQGGPLYVSVFIYYFFITATPLTVTPVGPP
jgi:hypothetical protein